MRLNTNDAISVLLLAQKLAALAGNNPISREVIGGGVDENFHAAVKLVMGELEHLTGSEADH